MLKEKNAIPFWFFKVSKEVQLIFMIYIYFYFANKVEKTVPTQMWKVYGLTRYMIWGQCKVV